jgi:hypothetical protein
MLVLEVAAPRRKAATRSIQKAAVVAFALALTTSACHCKDECRSAAQCASGICSDGSCVDPVETPPDAGDAVDTRAPDASKPDGG